VGDRHFTSRAAAEREDEEQLNQITMGIAPTTAPVGGRALVVIPSADCIEHYGIKVTAGRLSRDQIEYLKQIIMNGREAVCFDLQRRQIFNEVTLKHANNPKSTPISGYDFLVYLDNPSPGSAQWYFKANGSDAAQPVVMDSDRLFGVPRTVSWLDSVENLARIAYAIMRTTPQATTPALVGAPVSPPPAPYVVSDNSSVAVVIGISKYGFMAAIPGCKSDAEAFAAAFGRARRLNPNNVVLMTDGEDSTRNPTKSAIENRIRDSMKEAKPDGVALVYFSGHAVTQSGQAVLVAKDSKPEDGIPLSKVTAWLEESKARDKVLIIDACHAGAGEKGMKVVATPSLPPAPGVAMFLSCTGDESSYSLDDGTGSVYTNAFLHSLQDAGEDSSAITARSLQQRIESKMKAWRMVSGKQQTPCLILGDASDVTLVPNDH
jgi:hypothetical protein